MSNLRTTQTLVAIRKRARELMDQHGFESVPFRWDAAPRRAGAVHWNFGPRNELVPSHLSLSRKLIPRFSDDQIENTILHEIAHLIAGHSASHGLEWQRVARAIGCDGEKCWSYDAFRQPDEVSAFDPA